MGCKPTPRYPLGMRPLLSSRSATRFTVAAGNGDSAEAGKLWRSNPDNVCRARIDDGSADRSWLQADIEPDVRRESGSAPLPALGYSEADGTKRSDRARRACTSNDQRLSVPRRALPPRRKRARAKQLLRILRLPNQWLRLSPLGLQRQTRWSGRVTLISSSLRKAWSTVTITPGAPNDAARRAARTAGVNGNHVYRRALGGRRKGIR